MMSLKMKVSIGQMMRFQSTKHIFELAEIFDGDCVNIAVESSIFINHCQPRIKSIYYERVLKFENNFTLMHHLNVSL